MNTMDHLATLLREDRCKIRVRRYTARGLGDIFQTFFGTPTIFKSAWYVEAFDGVQWQRTECKSHRIAVFFAHAVSVRARRDGRATGRWEPVKAMRVVAREWQEAATQVEVAA